MDHSRALSTLLATEQPEGVLAVIGTALYVMLVLAGILSAAHAMMATRTPQGAIAWTICLIMLPVLALPAYWAFGRSKFTGYVKARRSGDTKIHQVVREAARCALERELFLNDSRQEQSGVGTVGSHALHQVQPRATAH